MRPAPRSIAIRLVQSLDAEIRNCGKPWNEGPKAFVRTKTAEQPAALGRLVQRISHPERMGEQLLMLRDGAMVGGYVGRTPEAVAESLVAAGHAVIGR